MSTRSLGRLTLDLVARIGGFTQGMSQAERVAQDRTRKIQRTFSTLQKSIGGVLAGLGATSLVRNIVSATAEAEHAIALLNNAVEQNGGAAGRTTQQLADMAGELQRVSTYSDDAVMGAQQLLLRFQSIQGLNFDRAVQSTLDLATALGTDLDAAAKLLGKALESPTKGMTQLERSGVVLEESQRDLIKQLMETGRQAEAQRVLLDELEKRYGGAAKAARDTLGGALQALKNASGELLEADGGLPGITREINRLTDVLEDERTKNAFQGLIRFLAEAGTSAIESSVQVTTAWDAILSSFSRDKTDAIAYAVRQLEQLERGGMFDRLQFRTFGGEERLAELRQMLREAEGLQKAIEETIPTSGGPRRRRGSVEAPPAVLPDEEELTEIIVTAQKIRTSAMESYYDELDRRTQTSEERQLAQFAEIEGALQELYDTGRITADQFNARWSEALSDILQEVEVTAKKIGDIQATMEEIPPYAERAADRAEVAFEEFFFDPVHKGIKGLGVDLIDTLRAAIAEGLADKLFLSKAEGGFGWGDAIGGLSTSIGGLLGFANGGSFTVGGSGGTDSQLVAFRATPGEMVNVRTPEARGGGTVVHMHNDFRGATVDAIKLFQASVPAIIQQAINGSRQAVRDDMSRGYYR